MSVVPSRYWAPESPGGLVSVGFGSWWGVSERRFVGGNGGKAVVSVLDISCGGSGILERERIVRKVLTEVYCVRVDDRAMVRLGLVMDDCCVWACRGDSVKGKADKVVIFPIDCYLGISQK